MGDLVAFPGPRRAPEPGSGRPSSARADRPSHRPPQPARVEPDRSSTPLLWREAAGQVLRQARRLRGETLAEVAARAGVSTPYLSEIERGRKDPSSEVLAAVAGALDLALADLAGAVIALLTPLDLTAGRRPTPSRPSGPLALAG